MFRLELATLKKGAFRLNACFRGVCHGKEFLLPQKRPFCQHADRLLGGGSFVVPFFFAITLSTEQLAVTLPQMPLRFR
jgi:hypothetical protein